MKSKLALVEIIRPKQWYKNLLIFVPLVFSLNLNNPESIFLSVIGFVILCLASGGSYIINDVLDYKKDLLHSEKKKRPIPSGRISKNLAILFGFILIGSSLYFANLLNTEFFIIVSLLIISNLLYSTKGKNIFLLDVFMISINFVLRAVAGAFVIDVDVSPWLIIGIFFVALLLAFAKRQNELKLLGEKANEHRKVLGEYSINFLNYSIGITSATVILAYSIYSIEGVGDIGDWRLVLTIPVVFFIVLLYVNNIIQGKLSSKEFNDLLTGDKKFLVSILVYIFMVIVLIYLIPSSFFN